MYMDATGTASKIFIMYHPLEADARRNLEHPTKTPMVPGIEKSYPKPETNRERSANRWLEDDPFLLGPGQFSGVNSLLVSGSVKSKNKRTKTESKSELLGRKLEKKQFRSKTLGIFRHILR